MRVCFVVLAFWAFCGVSLAQDTELSACKVALGKACRGKQPDSIASAYCKLSEYYAYRNTDSTRYFCLEGLKYARDSYPDAYIVLLVNLAETYLSEGDLQKAISIYRHTVAEIERLNYDKTVQIGILGSLGVVYRRQSKPDSALVYYKQALDLAEELHVSGEEAYLLTNIAILYTNNGRIDDGVYYIRRALDKAWLCDDIDMLMYAGSSAGAILKHAGSLDEAAGHMHRVLAKAREQQKPRFELKSLTYLLSVFQSTKQNDSIAYYLAEAEAVAKQLPPLSVEVQGFLDTQYSILADLGRYRESLAVLQKLVSSEAENLQTPVDRLYLAMARNYVALKDYKQAAVCYEQASLASDSLRKAELDKHMSEFTVKYKTQEKEIEIVRLEQEQMRQRTYIMQWIVTAVASLFALLVVVAVFVYRRNREKRLTELNRAKSYISGLESERKRLAKELHDGVCNDLLGVGMKMVYMEATSESKQEVQGLLERIRNEVRCISHELMPPHFKHLNLMELLETYVEQLTHPHRVRLHFEAEPVCGDWDKIPEEVACEVYRIAQEWLSNIVKHAQASEINVLLALTDNSLVLVITDNGVCRVDETVSSQGIGLSTIQERVKAMNALFTVTTSGPKQSCRLQVSF